MFFLLLLLVLPLIAGVSALMYNKIYNTRNAQNIRKQPPSLLFHSVSPMPLADLSYISCATLDALLSRINDNTMTTITAQQATECAAGKITTASGAYISLIFDDGFENFHTHALPLLEKYRAKASVFVVAGGIGQDSTWDVYRPRTQLSAPQIQSIARAGHEIGSHTLSHPDLVLLSDNDVRYELAESKKILESIIQKPVLSLSFPFGSWNTRIWHIARECGYATGVAYRNHAQAPASVIAVTGVYAFDSVEDILAKIERKPMMSNAMARSAIMPHFAKGAPVVKFRKTYSIINYFRRA